MSRHILDPNLGAHLPSGAERFRVRGDAVLDAATGLEWTRSANPLGFPLTWAEALDAVRGLNASGRLGHADWRMPNRRELRSLIHHASRQPALPPGHPFRDVFLGWVWTSSTKAGQPAYAWNAHLEGGRMFYSRKDEHRLLWPVRGGGDMLPRTGQASCFDSQGYSVPCPGSGQDGELRLGVAWPAPRFDICPDGVADRLTGLCWLSPARLPTSPLTWAEAVAWATREPGWRLPNINELESLVDAERAGPALPPELGPFFAVEGLWSATASGFDPAWAFVLYVQKGAVGVGLRSGREFQAWPVRDLV